MTDSVCDRLRVCQKFKNPSFSREKLIGWGAARRAAPHPMGLSRKMMDLFLFLFIQHHFFDLVGADLVRATKGPL